MWMSLSENSSEGSNLLSLVKRKPNTEDDFHPCRIILAI